MEQRFYSEINLDVRAKRHFDNEEDFIEYTKNRLVSHFLETIKNKADYTSKYSPEENMETHRFEVVILSPEEYSDLLLYKTIFESLNVNHQSLIDYFREER